MRAATTVITVRRSSRSSPCPGCRTSSERIHSRYLRRVADLPLAGRPVRLVVVARRFRCGADLCGRRMFTERFEDGVLAPWARRTGRLDHVVHHLGLALGGRPAASFARRLMLPVSNDTLLRVVRRRGSRSFAPPTVVGIDDWAWRRNQRVRINKSPARAASLTIPDKPSIAVLPFQNMSGDPEQEYFADGIVEEIITALCHMRWFFVIARNSSFIYKGRAVDMKQVGRELGVRYVLEGSVRKSGSRVRVTAQLIEAETGHHLVAEKYDRESLRSVRNAGRDRDHDCRCDRARTAEIRTQPRCEPAGAEAWMPMTYTNEACGITIATIRPTTSRRSAISAARSPLSRDIHRPRRHWVSPSATPPM